MTPADRAARERKQKIFVVVGGILLLGLLAIQLPRLLGGSSAPAASPSEETSVAGDQIAAAPRATVALVGAAPRLSGTPGKLTSFSEFLPKDPFVQQVVPESPVGEEQAAEGTDAAAGKKETEQPKKGEAASTPPTKEFTVGSSSGAAMTIVSVNGSRQALEPGAAFPAADPVFVLVAEKPEANTAVIGIVGGAYASGAKTTKLKVGKPLTLVNTTTGARFRIVLVAVGSGSGAEPAQSKATP